MQLTVKVHDEAVLAGLRETRREIRQDVKRITLQAAQKETLPTAKRMVPRFAAGSIIAKSTTGGAYLTTTLRGTRRATLGLLEFGGVAKGPIRPVRGRALKIGDRYAAEVTTPRVYRARGYLSRARRVTFDRYADNIEVAFAKLIQSRVTSTRTF